MGSRRYGNLTILCKHTSSLWRQSVSDCTVKQLLAIVHVFATCYAVHHGYGNPWSSISSGDRVTVEKALYASQILYLASISLTKISTSFFNARLTRDDKNIRFAHAWTGVCGAWGIASILVVAIRGDIAQPWSAVDGSSSMVGPDSILVYFR